MAFEEFTKKTARAAGTPYITIQKRGTISFNLAAYAALGEPKALTFLFDRERQLVGFRSADPAAEHAYAVRPNTKGTSHLVSGTLFTTYYGIPTDRARRWRARLIEDGVLTFDLNEAPQGEEPIEVGMVSSDDPEPKQNQLGRRRKPSSASGFGRT
jgi:hypothetical protein